MVRTERGTILHLETDNARAMRWHGKKGHGERRPRLAPYRVMAADAGPDDPSPAELEAAVRELERARADPAVHDRDGGLEFLAAEMIAYAIQAVEVGRRSTGYTLRGRAEYYRRERCGDGRRAMAWLESRSPRQGITFEDCCEALRVDVDVLRKRVFEQLAPAA